MVNGKGRDGGGGGDRLNVHLHWLVGMSSYSQFLSYLRKMRRGGAGGGIEKNTF